MRSRPESTIMLRPPLKDALPGISFSNLLQVGRCSAKMPIKILVPAMSLITQK